MRQHRSRRGSVLYLALLAIIALAGLSLAMVEIGASFSREVVARIDDERALYLAEAALAEAAFAITSGETGSVGSAANPARFGQGLLWSGATVIDGNRRVVTIAAAVGKGRAAIEAIVTPTAHPAQRFAVFTDDDLLINSASLIDSFDSTLGTYADQLAASATGFVNDLAVVASNGAIHVENPSHIQGDATPGPSRLATSAHPDAISGSTSPSDDIMYFDPVSTPALPASGALSASGGGVVTVPPGDYDFTSITVGTKSRLIVEGPARIAVGEWIIRSNAEFVFDSTGGGIEFYLSGDVDLASNSTIVTTTASALGVSVYLVGGPDQSVEFDSNSTFYGTIYGPQATVEISSNFEVFGSIAAYSLQLAANTRIHYDESLLNGSAGQLLVFAIQSWRRIEFPLQPLRADRRDPFQVMGLDRDLLLSPGALHDV